MKRPLKLGEQESAASTEDPERRVLSGKELARERRHAMYQRAKEQRANDPRHLAMKEAAKEQRRAAYQKLKTQRKAAATAEKAKLKAEYTQPRSEAREAKLKAEHTQPRNEERAASERDLTKLLLWMAKGSTAEN